MININKLNNTRDQREIHRVKIFKKVLLKVHHRIKVVAQKGECACAYIIPEYIYGIPRYDTLGCANFIVSRLRKNGFNVMYTFPNLVMISWGHVPSQYKQNIQNKRRHEELEKEKARLKLRAQKPVSKPARVSPDKSTKQFRMIDDYKVSKHFVNKMS